MRLILASASPRRRELIGRITDDFIVVPCDVREISTGSPEAVAVCNSRMKAAAVAGRRLGTVLGADTVVAVQGRILGKPADGADALDMLRTLCGRSHEVITGVTLADGNRMASAAEKTLVTFGDIPDDVINAYVASGKSYGKAGAYGIQDDEIGRFAVLQGDLFNVVGLPVALVKKLIKEFR